MTAPKTVLVVNDNQERQTVIERVLRELNYYVVLASSMENVLKRDIPFKINMALIDLFLPGMGGLACIEQVSARWPKAGVVAMSSAGMSVGSDPMMAAAVKAGAHLVLRQPFSVAQLTDKVERLGRWLRGEVTPGAHVMIIDDSRTVRTMVSKILITAGCRVSLAGSMEEAFEKGEFHNLDMVLTDIFMPGMGGLTGIEKIKDVYPKLPIVAMSGSAEAGDQGERALQAAEKVGAEFSLRKPFGDEDLVAAVSGIVGSYSLKDGFAGQGHVVDR